MNVPQGINRMIIHRWKSSRCSIGGSSPETAFAWNCLGICLSVCFLLYLYLRPSSFLAQLKLLELKKSSLATAFVTVVRVPGHRWGAAADEAGSRGPQQDSTREALPHRGRARDQSGAQAHAPHAQGTPHVDLQAEGLLQQQPARNRQVSSHDLCE